VILILVNNSFDDTQIYVEGPSTHAVQTAWAMLALILAGQVLFSSSHLFSAKNYSLVNETRECIFICNQSSQHLQICKYLDVLG
jgi:hypothetical protein